jgi:hypothetical protein
MFMTPVYKQHWRRETNYTHSLDEHPATKDYLPGSNYAKLPNWAWQAAEKPFSKGVILSAAGIPRQRPPLPLLGWRSEGSAVCACWK